MPLLQHLVDRDQRLEGLDFICKDRLPAKVSCQLLGPQFFALMSCAQPGIPSTSNACVPAMNVSQQ